MSISTDRISTTVAGLALAATFAIACTAPPAAGHGTGRVPEVAVAKMPFAPGTKARAERGSFPKEYPKVGTVRTFPMFDYVAGHRYLFDFTLRALTAHAEVWVASGSDGISSALRFPAGDCRNGQPTAVTIRQAVLDDAVRGFEERAYPRLTSLLRRLTPRDGKDALLPKLIPSIPSSAYKGDGDRVVILVGNIRDENFYDRGSGGPILGVALKFWRLLLDRNVFVMDSAWWEHLVGGDPAPVPGGACSPSGSHPYDVDATLAHEFTHVLQHDGSGHDRLNTFDAWLDEGVADWGALRSVPAAWENLHLRCLLTCPAAGPENSLTDFGDSNTPGADYAVGETFAEALTNAGGTAAVAATVNSDGPGLPRVRNALRATGSDRSDEQLMQDWSTLLALDAVLERGATLRGGDAARFQTPLSTIDIDWANPTTHRRPGAPPNGADFVRLRDADGDWLRARDIGELRFDGDADVQPDPVQWTVDDGSLHVGGRPSRDDAIVRRVQVPAADPTLTFRTRHEIEEGWDFGFVQVSTDGGNTYRSLPSSGTTTNHDPDADPAIVAQLPGFSGSSGGWREERVDLSAHAGKEVLLAFRYMTDPAVDPPGWWLDDIRIGSGLISDGTTLEGWLSHTGIRPTPVASLRARVVGHTEDGRTAFIRDLPLDTAFDGRLTGEELRAVAGDADTVAVLVNHYDPTGQLTRPARYRLEVDGVLQPGG